MKKSQKLISLLLALVMCVGLLSACTQPTEKPVEKPAETPAEKPAEKPAETPEKDTDTPVVVGEAHFSSKFSPFFAESAYDTNVVKTVNTYLMNLDRQGAPIYKGIEGETISYNGTDYTYKGPADITVTEQSDGKVFYDIKLREDLTFSDGEKMTIDDVIFTMYVYSDPTYDGSTTLFSTPIEGMAEYRSGMDKLMNLITKAGRDNTDFTYWTEEEQKAFWADVDQAGVKFVTEIKDYLVDSGSNTKDDPVNVWAPNWGYEVPEGATELDLFNTMCEAYEWDLATLSSKETAGSSLFDLMEDSAAFQKGVSTGDSAPNISGIQKTGDYSMRIVTTKVDATMIYQLEMFIAPLHYYGDKSLYDYDNNKFGFEKGDLSIVRTKTTQPMGAGPYKFIKFENGTVYFEANDNYYKGSPKTKYINYIETVETDKINGLTTGTIDITDPSFSKDASNAISDINGGGLDGPVISVHRVDNLGYGYIGLNANRINVGGEANKGSEASKNLRKAFGTVLSVYRDVAVDSYYGDAASVINYPISNTSWAAPQKTDDGYKIAFSTDADGNEIYTSDMSDDAKYEAALKAALGFFEKAGYTVADGKVTQAPEGAKMEYELWIPADGVGDHPSFMICSLASDAFKKIGINLIIKDLTRSADLWDGLDAGTVDMWCAAWQASSDPDMYQIYYSDIANGGANKGGSNTHYNIADEELDTLILDARASTDQAYRKVIYKNCLDIIVDWAVEIPVYQRQNAIAFSAERVNMDSVVGDITTFYEWIKGIENIELTK